MNPFPAIASFFIFTLMLSPPVASAQGTSGESFRSRIDFVFDALDRGSIPTGILYDKVLPLSGIERFQGTEESDVVDLRTWKQIYFEMFHSSFEQDEIPALSTVTETARHRIREGVIPIGLLRLDFNWIREDAVQQNLLRISGSRYEDVAGRTETPYEERTVFVASALKPYTYYETTVFSLGNEFLIGNGDEEITNIEIDFDDGLGFRQANIGSTWPVRYLTPGERTLTVRVVACSGGLTSFSRFEVRRIGGQPAEAVDPDLIWENQVASRSYLGEFAVYDAYSFFGDGNTAITRPIIFVEGFDVENTFGWEEIYDLLTTEDLAATLQSAGYDLVILNFHDATDYLQRNSFALTTLIEQVRDMVEKEDLIVAGASMGGLISRHSLAWMETNGIDHETELFLSFDSPHAGANIPLGLQHWVEFFSEHDATAEEFLGKLNAPGAQQMLVYHHTTGNTENPLRTNFLADLSSVGDYPEGPGLRTAAIANGSGAGMGSGQIGNGGATMAPGDQIVEYEYYSLLVDIIGNCWAIPDNDPLTQILEGRVDLIWPLPDDDLDVFIDGTGQYDNAPGGWRGSMQDLADIDMEYGDITTAFPNHCFIPTTSALDLKETDGTPVDLLHDLNDDPELSEKTPFGEFFFPASSVNEEHVTITPDNVVFILDNILVGQPPVLADIPDQSILTGERFRPLRVDNLVRDPDDPDSLIAWTFEGNQDLTIRWMGTRRGFRIRAPDGWTGSETVTFTATDPDGLSDSDEATFTVSASAALMAGQELRRTDLTPTKTDLIGSYPNPFNPTTTIKFHLSEQSYVRLTVFNPLGQEVVTLVEETLPAGVYDRTWNALGVPSGVYFSRLEARSGGQARHNDDGRARHNDDGQAGGFVATRKLVLLK